MSAFSKLSRLRQLASLPETRRVMISTVRSGHLQNAAHRAVHDRVGLARDLRSQWTDPGMIRATIEHPATRELAGAGLLFLPVRYVPLGWAATWAARRLIGRIASKPVRPIKNVTPNPG